MDGMLKQGAIRPSPVVLVAKRDGFCNDYQKLNAVTKMDVFPLLRIDNSLDMLVGSHYFTMLDLVTGF